MPGGFQVGPFQPLPAFQQDGGAGPVFVRIGGISKFGIGFHKGVSLISVSATGVETINVNDGEGVDHKNVIQS